MSVARAALGVADPSELPTGWELQPWSYEDFGAFCTTFAQPGLKLCAWRTPFARETCEAFAGVFTLGWRPPGPDDPEAAAKLREIFGGLGHPYVFTLLFRGAFRDIGVIMRYSDNTAALSGFVTPSAAAVRFAAVRELVEIAREGLMIRALTIADVPGAREIAERLGLPRKPTLLKQISGLNEEQMDWASENLQLLERVIPGTVLQGRV